MKTIFTLLFSLVLASAFSQPVTHLVISQVYGGGGNSAATYTNDYIEIFNPTSAQISVAGYSLQYASAAGTWSTTNSVGITTGIIPAGGYFLVQLAAGGTPSGSLPTPDANPSVNLGGTSTSINMSASNGKIALVSNQTILTGATCPVATPASALVDFVGYGTANCAEGTAAAAPANNATALIRKSGGCQDNDNNSADFVATALTAAPYVGPRNSATAVNICNNTTPTINISPASLVMTTTVGTASTAQTFTISASNLLFGTGVTIVPSAGLEISQDGVTFFPGGFTQPQTSSGTLASTTLYARLTSTASAGAFTGTITASQTSVTTSAVLNVTGGVATAYYTKSSGSLEVLGTYGVNTDGSGASPADFTSAYQYFIVTQANATIGAAFSIAGTGSKLVVGNGTTTTTVTIPAAFAISSTTKVDVSNLGTLIDLNNIVPSLNIVSDGSTVNLAEVGLTSSDTVRVPAVSFFNLKLTSGLKYFPGNTTTIRGDLTMDGAKGLNGPNSTPFATINSFGNINFINGSTFDANPTGDAGRLTLKMNGSAAIQTINGPGGNLLLFRLERDSTVASTIALTSGTNITVGNASSGGLLLSPATATLSLPTNTSLSLLGGAVVTPASLGKINASGGSISILKSAGTANAGILRFVSGSTLSTFTINFDPAFARDSITVNDSISILQTLTLTKGKILTTSPSVILMQSAASFSGGSTASYIDGKISKTGSTNFTFPVGNAGKYAPVQLSSLSGSNTFTAQYFNTPYSNTTSINTAPPTPANYNVSKKEYWTVDRTNAATTAVMTLPWDANSGVTNPSAVRIAHWGGNSWDDAGGTSSGTTSSGSVTSTILAFSPFTLGAGTFNVLPIQLVSFTAQKSNNTVRLAWTTQQEINAGNYVIERSADGNTWSEISSTNAIGGSGSHDYSVVDNSPNKGLNYYRLKEVDINGRFQYSLVRIISFSKEVSIIIAPNPARDVINVNLIKSNNNLLTITLTDVNGKFISKQNTMDSQVKIDAHNLSKGTYFVKITDGENVTIQKVMVN